MNSNNTSNKSTESPVGFRSDLNRNELTTRDELMINLAHFAMDHAKIIYYYHGTREWRSIYLNDDIVYRNEMKILARGYREGEISVIWKEVSSIITSNNRRLMCTLVGSKRRLVDGSYALDPLPIQVKGAEGFMLRIYCKTKNTAGGLMN
jgi:hypothetical protein